MIVNFVYNNQKYPIEAKLLNKETDYFVNNYKQEWKQNIEIQLLNEFENNDEFSTDIITTFLNYFKTGQITLTPSNIFCLNFLFNKYEIINIQKKTTIYMKNNYKELIDNILNKYEQKTNKQRYQTNRMKQEEEKLLSSHLIEYIEDHRLQLIPIHNLYRIIELYSKKKLQRKSKQKQNQKEKEKMKTKFNEIDDNDKDDLDENHQNENSEEIEMSNTVNMEEEDDEKSEEEESKQIKKRKTIKRKPQKKRFKKNKRRQIKNKNKNKTKNKTQISTSDFLSDDDFYEEQEEEDKKMIDFLINIHKIRGIESEILFNVIELDDKGEYYLIERLSTENIDELIDMKFLMKKTIQHFRHQDNELQEQIKEQQQTQENIKETYEKSMKELKKEIQEMKEYYEQEIEINKIERIKEISKMNDIIESMKEKQDSIISELKEEYESKIKKIEEKYDKKINKISNEQQEKDVEIDNKIKLYKEENQNYITKNINELSTIIDNNQNKYEEERFETLYSEMSTQIILFNHMIDDHNKSYNCNKLLEFLIYLMKNNLEK